MRRTEKPSLLLEVLDGTALTAFIVLGAITGTTSSHNLNLILAARSGLDNPLGGLETPFGVIIGAAAGLVTYGILRSLISDRK